MDDVNLVVVLGLFWDVAGVIILAVGLLAVSDKDILHYRSLDGIENLALDLFVQKVDTSFGLTALVLGFSLQTLGALHVAMARENFWIGVSLLTMFIVAFVMRHRSAVKQKQKLSPELSVD